MSASNNETAPKALLGEHTTEEASPVFAHLVGALLQEFPNPYGIPSMDLIPALFTHVEACASCKGSDKGLMLTVQIWALDVMEILGLGWADEEEGGVEMTACTLDDFKTEKEPETGITYAEMGAFFVEAAFTVFPRVQSLKALANPEQNIDAARNAEEEHLLKHFCEVLFGEKSLRTEEFVNGVPWGGDKGEAVMAKHVVTCDDCARQTIDTLRNVARFLQGGLTAAYIILTEER